MLFFERFLHLLKVRIIELYFTILGNFWEGEIKKPCKFKDLQGIVVGAEGFEPPTPSV